MFDALAQGLWSFILIIVFLIFVFLVFVCWKIRAELKDLFLSLGRLILTFGIELRKALKDEYTRDEIIKSIGYHDLRGNTKSADYWRRELSRKFPEDQKSMTAEEALKEGRRLYLRNLR